MTHLFLFMIQPWHLIALAVVGFLVFGAMSLGVPGTWDAASVAKALMVFEEEARSVAPDPQ